MDDGKVGQKKLDLDCAHRRRMSLAVETDEASNPVDIRLFSADAVMPKADPIADLIEQARGGGVTGLPCRKPLGGTK